MPTWRGWLLLLLVFSVLGVGLVRGLGPFLAVNDPGTSGFLVVEGWSPDYAMEAALAEFKRGHYDKVFVTGGPLEAGAPLSEYKTFAELGAATLRKMGLETNEVQPVPSGWVRQDRTYASAVKLRQWLHDHNQSSPNIHLITVGPHARRSRLLFEKALGSGVKVGVTAISAPDYDLTHWWRSSAGVRTVTNEALAYLYARFLHVPRE